MDEYDPIQTLAAMVSERARPVLDGLIAQRYNLKSSAAAATALSAAATGRYSREVSATADRAGASLASAATLLEAVEARVSQALADLTEVCETALPFAPPPDGAPDPALDEFLGRS